MVVSPVDSPLKLTPKAFDGICVNHPIDVLLHAVIDGAMKIAHLEETALVALPLVRVDGRLRFNVVADERKDGMNVAASECLRADTALTLNRSNNGRFIVSAEVAGLLAADKRLIDFHGVLKRGFGLFKQLANLAGHAPRCFVGDARLPLNLHSGNAVLRMSEKEDSEEPCFQGRLGLMKDRARKNMKLERAELASPALPACDTVKVGLLMAVRAIFHRTVAVVEKLIQAIVFGLIFSVEILDREFGFHVRLPVLIGYRDIIAK